MKTLSLKCRDCGARARFTGPDVDDIIRQVDTAGWGGRDEVCPQCWADTPEPSAEPE